MQKRPLKIEVARIPGKQLAFAVANNADWELTTADVEDLAWVIRDFLGIVHEERAKRK